MNLQIIPCPATLRRTARILVVALAPLAAGACYQLWPTCGFLSNLFGASDCSVSYDDAQFSSNAGYTIHQGTSADTIILTSGWVYVTPSLPSDTATDATPVFVQTTYVVAGSDSPWPPHRGHARPPSRVATQDDEGSANGAYLVMAFNTGSTLDSTVVALVSGSMITPALSVGCQIMYYPPPASPSSPAPFSQTVQDTLTIDVGVQFTVPATC